MSVVVTGRRAGHPLRRPARSAAPADFSPLRPYVALSPADRAVAAQSFLLPAYQVFSMRSPTREIGVFARRSVHAQRRDADLPEGNWRGHAEAAAEPTGHLAGTGRRPSRVLERGRRLAQLHRDDQPERPGNQQQAGCRVRCAPVAVRPWRLGRASPHPASGPRSRPPGLPGSALPWQPRSGSRSSWSAAARPLEGQLRGGDGEQVARRRSGASSAANAPVLTSGLAGSIVCRRRRAPAGRRSTRRVVNGYHVQTMRQRLAERGSMSRSCVPRMRMGST